MPSPSRSLQKAITEWIAHARTHSPSDVSRDGTAIRLYADIGGTIFIRPDGSLISESEFPTDDKWQLDSRWRTVALVVGARTHPELRELLPTRPASAADCLMCSGSGIWNGLVCGACFGLGWTPAA